MGLRTQTFILGVAATLASPCGMALGLGEIKIKSGINQPLNAEILLQQTRDLTDREILVGLASQADFDRVGVDKPALLGDLKFRVEPSGTGLLVRVTSTKPILEPYLNFIVQAQWPSGKLLREYTVLVDLPVYSGDAGDAVSAAQATATADVPKVQTSISEAPEPRPRSATASTRSSGTPKAATRAANPDAPAPKASGETYGPVAPKDTLWKIAKKVRQDGSANINQTMQDLLRLNPDAFVDGNIDKLRLGQVLRLPAKDDATQAANESAARPDVTSKTPGGKPTAEKPQDDTKGPQLEGSNTYSAPDKKAEALEGRVKLTSSNAADGSKTGRGAGTDQGNRESLANELSITKEELDAKNRGAADLKARLQAVDEQIENTQKLIDVTSEEMRKLEVAIQQNRGDPAQAGETPAAVEAPAKAPDAAGEVADLYNKPSDGAVGTVAPSAAQSAAPAAKPPQPPVAPVSPEPSLLDKLQDNLIFVAVGLAGLLGLGLWIANRRKRQAGEEPAFSWNPDEKDDLSWDVDAPAAEFEAPAVVKAPDYPAAALSSQLVAAPEEIIKVETDDAVSESDIHIALGDFDTAEKLLLSALEQDPANTRVLLKLLEIYSRKGDVASFDPQYAKLRSFGNPEAVERGEQLRDYIEDAPPFNAAQFGDEAFFAAVNATPPAAGSGPETSAEAPLSDDITAYGPAFGGAGSSLADAAAVTTAVEFDAVLGDEFDLDDYSSASAVAEDEAFDEDFSLDFGELDEVEIAQSSDRGSLAEAMASAGSEADLDLSPFDDFKFDVPDAVEGMAEPQLSDHDFDLDSLADDGDIVDSLELGLAPDIGASGLDALLPTQDAAEEDGLGDTDFSDLDLSQLDLDEDLSSFAHEQDLDHFDATAQQATHAESLEGQDIAGLDFDLADLDLPELDLADSAEQTELLSDAPDDGDYAALDFDLSGTELESVAAHESIPALEEEPLEEKSLEGLMNGDDVAPDLDLSETELEAVAALESVPVLEDEPLETLMDEDDQADFESEPETYAEQQLTPPPEPDEGAVDDVDFEALAAGASDNLDFADFDDIDADLDALADGFEGDSAELDDLALEESELELMPSTAVVMDEPVTDFGELDDDALDEVAGQLGADHADDISDIEEVETLAIEEPQTDLDAEPMLTLEAPITDLDEGELAALEEPQTDLDDAFAPSGSVEADWDVPLSGEFLSDEEDDLALGGFAGELISLPDNDDDLLGVDTLLSDTKTPRYSEFGTLSNMDDAADLDDFVEFEELDQLDALMEADVDSDERQTDDLAVSGDRLNIPAAPESFSSDYDIPHFDPESDDDSDLDGLFDGDALATKLDLLRAFVEMGDEDSAKHTLNEILEEGTAEQRQQAEALFARLA